MSWPPTGAPAPWRGASFCIRPETDRTSSKSASPYTSGRDRPTATSVGGHCPKYVEEGMLDWGLDIEFAEPWGYKGMGSAGAGGT